MYISYTQPNRICDVDTRHSCNEATYDFFVVHRGIAHAAVGAQRLENGGTNPHWPFPLVLRGDAWRYEIQKIVKSPNVEGFLPQGPAPPPSVPARRGFGA